MSGDLDPRALARFGARPIAELGGRLNRHWLVEAPGGRRVLRRWWQPRESIRYEAALLARLAQLGWPVAPPLSEPERIGEAYWSLSAELTGQPLTHARPPHEQRTIGRLMAALHADTAGLAELGQRPGWRPCDATLADPEVERLLRAAEPRHPEEAAILRWHYERARELLAQVAPRTWPRAVVHGDLTPWNVRFAGGRLSGLLDFELARWDYRVADFALAWRGAYDGVIHGYREVAPLGPEELALLTPMWWASLIEGLLPALRQGQLDDGWTVKMLLRRSPLMGPGAAPYRSAG